MVFYKIEAVMVTEEEKKELSRQEHRARANEIAEKSEEFFQKCDQNRLMFVVAVQDDRVTCGCILKENEKVCDLFAKYAKLLPFSFESFKAEEITFSALQSLLSSANRNSYVQDADDILESFEITDLASRYSDENFGEALIDTTKERTEIADAANSLLFNATMLPELERIYQKSPKKAEGHPVHYIVQTDDREARRSVYKNLLSALYNNGRIKNQRYSYVDYCAQKGFPGATIDTLYRSSYGGTVVIRYADEDTPDGQFGRRGNDIIAALLDGSSKRALILPRSKYPKWKRYNPLPIWKLCPLTL